jgi:putative restriction endonuclease
MSKLIEKPQQKDLAHYCKCFANLNVSNNKNRGKAQHKPILILSVLDLIAQGLIVNNRILVSDELIKIFNKYWDVFVESNSTYEKGIHYPFFHLRNDGFWHLKSDIFPKGLRIKTTNKLRELVEYAYLDDDLFNLLQDPLTRQVLIDSLVSTWFTGSQTDEIELLDINQSFTRVDLSELENFDREIKFTWNKSVIRNSFFRKSVVHAYDYRCVFCKIRITRNPNQNIVDGAHIKPFADFLDSKIDNGLSLCKNHHWAFDLGWFSIDDNYKILVAQDLEEDSPHHKLMKDFHHEPISLPSKEQYFPRLEALEWHRQNKFKY